MSVKLLEVSDRITVLRDGVHEVTRPTEGATAQELARLILPFAALLGIALLLKGHDAPGGGFVAGLSFAVAGILVGAYVARERAPKVTAALLGVPLALAPFNNILPKTTVLFAERYCYVALLPFALGMAALASSSGWIPSELNRMACDVDSLTVMTAFVTG